MANNIKSTGRKFMEDSASSVSAAKIQHQRQHIAQMFSQQQNKAQQTSGNAGNNSNNQSQ
ncbi:hypothetical protein SAMN02745671_01222 [Anaerovibrio lipolyticus DSM 3074]|uniref:Uncharacterized protein n=2 Tax=Anaerovibrio lipolyticus TaxID=82374 RepID=A0A0B2K2U7_9FIRM|nr:hypothetical protein [Anaerovibrio lipolyticus]KHM52467.1 hypothetical protein NZ47_04645 [Anaerovibrio lipolyticus]SHI64594.1 hypothetical protein SAMN02745671_01222 [Anaerovibrio lipolyticus DSM 3074]